MGAQKKVKLYTAVVPTGRIWPDCGDLVPEKAVFRIHLARVCVYLKADYIHTTSSREECQATFCVCTSATQAPLAAYKYRSRCSLKAAKNPLGMIFSFIYCTSDTCTYVGRYGFGVCCMKKKRYSYVLLRLKKYSRAVVGQVVCSNLAKPFGLCSRLAAI